MNGAGDHHVKQNKPDTERQVSHVLFVIRRGKKDLKVEEGLLENTKGNRRRGEQRV
jgi:hypothetical protein